MFTPEFVIEEKGEFLLVANHALGTAEQVALSVAYNLARVEFGRSHIPASIAQCRVIYDIRGQDVPPSTRDAIVRRLAEVADVEFRD
ncbi:MAG: hypothetical protein QM766_15770 [Burkholderiaceae bacterium]